MELTICYWQISIKRIWPSHDQLAAIYNKAAPWWHAAIQQLGVCHAYSRLFQRLNHERVLDHLEDASTVLDGGIGTGAFSLALTKAVPCQLQICGADLSDTMVATAHSLLRQAGVRVQVDQQDIRTLPYADDTFDLVMSAHMLEHLPDPGVGLREMIRVLRPGTPVLLAVTRFGPIGGLLHLRWGNGSFTSEALSALLAEAGLKDIRFYPFTTGWSRWTSFACLGFKD